MCGENLRELGFKIGEVEVPHGLSLAPMAGNTNLAYRRLCRKFGAEMTTTEMVSSLALKFGDKKTLSLLIRGEDEFPVAAQLFGNQPDALQAAAGEIEERGFHIVDLNMGCPAPKITGGGGGSALLRDPDLAQRCVESMTKGTCLPVTVKMRCGWDERDISGPIFAKRMQDAGVQALTVHGRTREQKYRGQSNLDAIAKIKQAVSIPVIGNGDVVDLDSAKRMLATGVDGIAIGRGAMGRPWLFNEIRAWMDCQPIPSPPSLIERGGLMMELGHGVVALYGEHRGMRIMRRLAPEFFKGMKGAPTMRQKCNRLELLSDLQELVDQLNERN